MNQLISRRKVASLDGINEVIDEVQTGSKSPLLQCSEIDLFVNHEGVAGTQGQCTYWMIC